MNKLLSFTLSAVVLCACARQTPVVTCGGFVFGDAPFASCHAATIVECPEGELHLAFFGGSYEGASDVRIYLSSKNLSDSLWTGPSVVARDSLYACWNPVLYPFPDGRLALFYKSGPQVRMWKGHCMFSEDGGCHWSAPDNFSDGLFGAIKNKPVTLSSGRIVCGSSDEREGWKIHFELSDDNGVNWRKCGPVDADDSIGVIQPSILLMPDGSLTALCRSRNGKVAYTRSADGGETWSRVALLDLPNNNSGLDAVNLPDGRFALVCNPVGNTPGRDNGPRTPLCLMISDDALHWECALTLESGEGEYSYPSAIVGSDGELHIAYTWNRTKIKYVKISL